MVAAVRVKGELDPLLTKRHINSLSVSEDEESSGAKVLRWNGRGILLQRAARSI